MFANLPTYQFCFSFVESTDGMNADLKEAVQCWSCHARTVTGLSLIKEAFSYS